MPLLVRELSAMDCRHHPNEGFVRKLRADRDGPSGLSHLPHCLSLTIFLIGGSRGPPSVEVNRRLACSRDSSVIRRGSKVLPQQTQDPRKDVSTDNPSSQPRNRVVHSLLGICSLCIRNKFDPTAFKLRRSLRGSLTSGRISPLILA